MAKTTREDVLSYLESANMLEVSELINDIEDKFGVSSAAPVAVAAAPSGGAQAGDAEADHRPREQPLAHRHPGAQAAPQPLRVEPLLELSHLGAHGGDFVLVLLAPLPRADLHFIVDHAEVVHDSRQPLLRLRLGRRGATVAAFLLHGLWEERAVRERLRETERNRQGLKETEGD